MSDELKPCPFCGCNYPGVEGDQSTGMAVRCVVCDGQGGEAFSREEAIQKWNRRAPATLDQAKQVLTEAGMVVVPVEPTEAMLLAAKKADCDHSDKDDWLFEEREYGDVTRQYKAMIAAQGEGNEH